MTRQHHRLTRLLLIPSLPLLAVFLMPTSIHANPSAATTGNNTGITYECAPTIVNVNGKLVPLYGDCTFFDLIAAVRTVVNVGIEFALAFSVVVLAYAGSIYMTSGGVPQKRAQANTMLWKVIVGISLILSAWLIVNLITSSLLNGAARQAVPFAQ